jgi:hypothetical protein
MARGTTLQDPTLDLCGGSFPSENSRVARRQISVTKVGSPYQFLSSETVRYSNVVAASGAYSELKKSYEDCIKNKGGTENGLFINYSFQELPSSFITKTLVTNSLVVRATLGVNPTARQLLAVYQFNGVLFTGLYVVKSGSKPIEDSETLRWLNVASLLSNRLSASNG